MGFHRLILVGVFTGIYVRKLSKYVQDVKFVNIKKFFVEFGIKVDKNAVLHLGRLKDLEITSNSTFYNLRDDYGLVVYN